MKNVSVEFKQAMSERRNFYYSAEIDFANGESIELTQDDIAISGNTITESTDKSSFPVGSAIGKRLTFSIRNNEDQYSEYDFYNAEIQVYLHFDLSETTESINLGKYTVRDPETYGSTITITAIDNMYKADTDFKGMNFPGTVRDTLLECCDYCGLTLLNTDFPNNDFIIPSAPSNITNRQFIGMCAMIAGGNAVIDDYGRLKIVSYDLSYFERNNDYDGGLFDTSNPYATGDQLDGGSFSPWNDGNIADGGSFLNQNNYHVFFKNQNLTISTDDVIITGVRINGKDETSYMYGEEGYVLELENQLATGNEEDFIERIGKLIVGLKFRPFTADHVSYPLAEFGDLCYVVDRKNRIYQSVITDIDFAFRGFTTIKCTADSPQRNSSKFTSNAETKAVIKARQEAEEQITQYDKSVQLLTTIIANSMGMFTTVERLQSGGEIVYQHNKPNLSESNIIWKKTESAFSVSTDGGKTWNAGIDANGNVVVNVLSAVGINFDWARGGTITLGGVLNGNGKLIILDASGAQVGYIDNTGVNFQKGTFSGTVSAANIQGSNILGGQIVSAKNNNITDQKIVIEESRMEFYMPGYSYYLEEELYYAGSLYPSNNTNNAWEDGTILTEELPVMRMETEYGYELHVSDTLILSSLLDTGYDKKTILTTFHELVSFEGGILTEELEVEGTKSRLVKDTSFGDILMYCQESAIPYFTDIGTGIINDDGECIVAIDSIFLETINTNVEYCVFLQKEGPGDLWVAEKDFAYFTVHGTPGLKFSWEIKAVQNGYEEYRLEDKNLKMNVYESDAFSELDLALEQEEITYADFESFSDY